jgi:cytochrome b pre-mRNA-processing protein 3
MSQRHEASNPRSPRVGPRGLLSRWLRRSPERLAVDRLYAAIVAAARREIFYRRGVPDTIDGRFAMLALHAWAVLKRLRSGDREEQAVAQALVDRIFAELDRAYREMGVGDLSVGKRVRRAVEVFYGALEAYEQAAARGEEALAAALARNVWGDEQPNPASRWLALCAAELSRALDRQPREGLLSGEILFPEVSA